MPAGESTAIHGPGPRRGCLTTHPIFLGEDEAKEQREDVQSQHLKVATNGIQA